MNIQDTAVLHVLVAVTCKTLACDLELLLMLHVTDVIHPISLPFQERYRIYSENLESPLEWEVSTWTTDLPHSADL